MDKIDLGDEYEEDYDDHDFGEIDEALQRSLESKADYRPYKCLTVQDAHAMMDEINGRISVTNNLPSSISKALLCKYQWNCCKLNLDLGTDGLVKLLQKNGFSSLAAMIGSLSNNINPTEEELEGTVVECPICFRESPSELIPKPECGDKVCLSCWQEHFRQKVDKEGEGVMIICPMCPYIVKDSLIKEVIPDLREKLESNQVNCFAKTNPLVTWCPGTNCAGRIISVDRPTWGPGPVTCNHCNQEFCFACSREWHAPLRCDLIEIWEKEVKDSCQSLEWIKGNSKPCPKCGVSIEKNGGCNHMRCINQTCKYEFCWICLGLAHDHSFDQSRCTFKTPEQVKTAKERQNKSKLNAEHFVFQSDRYFAHMRSLKLEEKLPETINQAFDEALRRCGTNNFSVDILGLKNAIKILHRCRRMLAYGYAFAYFLLHSSTNGETHVYLQNLGDLHGKTETLSYLMEQKLKDSANSGMPQFQEVTRKVLESSIHCDERRLKVVTHVMENYERGLWNLKTEFSEKV